MAVPVINTTTSVLAFQQWTPWRYNFAAVGAPFKWSIVDGNLPDGVSLEKQYDIEGLDSTDVMESDAPFQDGDLVAIASKSGGSGLAVNTRYYLVNADAEAGTFQLSLTFGGAAVSFGSDVTAGKIYRVGDLSTGGATVPGVFPIHVVATNGDGDSTMQKFAIGIEPAAASLDANVDLVWDFATNVVAPRTSWLLPDTSAPEDSRENPAKPVLVGSITEGDDILSNLLLVKHTTVLDLPVIGLEIAVKHYEPDAAIADGNAFLKKGSGANTIYQHYFKPEGDLEAAAMKEYEADDGTFFYALAQYTVTYSNTADIGPATIQRTSRTFLLRIDRDFSDNA